MSASVEFDSFYGRARRRVLLLALMQTGDPERALSLTVQTFREAWRQWGTAARPDPGAWVRSRLLWHAVRSDEGVPGLGGAPRPDAEQAALLARLQSLAPSARACYGLVDGLGLEPVQAARDVGVTPGDVEVHLRRARDTVHRPLDQDLAGESPDESPWTASEVVAALSELSRGIDLPAPPAIRAREESTGSMRYALAGLGVVALVLAVVAVLVSTGSPSADVARPAAGPPVSSAADATPTPVPADEVPASVLLGAQDLAVLGGGDWAESATDATPAPAGAASLCQRTRTADPAAVGSRTRELTSGPSALVQSVTLSGDVSGARDSFDRTVGWWSDCTGVTALLTSAYDVPDVADSAVLLSLRDWSRPTAAYTVAVARTGRAVVSLVSKDPTADGVPPVAPVATLLRDAVAAACGLGGSPCGSGRAGASPAVKRVAPPSPTDRTGVLHTVDLPPPTGVRRPWTASRPGNGPRSATRCDNLSLGTAGAGGVTRRHFGVPGQARLPAYLGLSESVGRMKGTRAAARLVATVSKRVNTCPRRVRGARVAKLASAGGPQSDQQLRFWAVYVKNRGGRDYFVRTGFVRVGRDVAQVTFTPGPRNDLTRDEQIGLLRRAQARLDGLRT